jgi:hypothetical protein
MAPTTTQRGTGKGFGPSTGIPNEITGRVPEGKIKDLADYLGKTVNDVRAAWENFTSGKPVNPTLFDNEFAAMMGKTKSNRKPEPRTTSKLGRKSKKLGRNEDTPPS